jgi:CubicO group peptidase (beta-lactamase class C family)
VLTVLELLILQERGKLSFDDSARKYFPTLNLSPDITLEMLASQMSGIGRDRTINPIPPDLDLTNYVAGTCGYSYFGCSEQQFLDYIGRFPPVFQPETQASCISLS